MKKKFIQKWQMQEKDFHNMRFSEISEKAC